MREHTLRTPYRCIRTEIAFQQGSKWHSPCCDIYFKDACKHILRYWEKQPMGGFKHSSVLYNNYSILCGKGGKYNAISVAADVCGTSRRRGGLHFAQDRSRLTARATHTYTIFCHASYVGARSNGQSFPQWAIKQLS